MFGLTGTRESTADGMSGFRVGGAGLRMRGLTGAIRTMTITTMAGNCMRAIGTMRAMTIIITTKRGGFCEERPGFRRVSLFWSIAG
jgi:hypothetical protein